MVFVFWFFDLSDHYWDICKKWCLGTIWMGWGPVDWVGRVLPEAKFKIKCTSFFEFFWFERPLLRYLLKTVLHCKGSGIWVDAITQVRLGLWVFRHRTNWLWTVKTVYIKPRDTHFKIYRLHSEGESSTSNCKSATKLSGSLVPFKMIFNAWKFERKSIRSL